MFTKDRQELHVSTIYTQLNGSKLTIVYMLDVMNTTVLYILHQVFLKSSQKSLISYSISYGNQ